MRLSIPTPCHEDWSAMTPTERGRFCQSCRKEVVDFSGMTDAELVARLRQTSGTVCGRLRTDQVERSLLLSSSWNLGQAVRRRMAGIYGFAALVGGMLLQSGVAVAQRIAPTVMVPAQRYEESDAQEPATEPSAKALMHLQGYVLEANTCDPIPFAWVSVKDKSSRTIGGDTSDIYGFFSFDISTDTLKSAIVHVGFPGYYEQKVHGSSLHAGIFNFELTLKDNELWYSGGITLHESPWYERLSRRISQWRRRMLYRKDH